MTGVTISNWSFKEGQTMTITGFVKSNATYFVVNIISNNDDIALHINPRFSARCDENKVAVNSFKGGVWGLVLQLGNPFTQGKDFKIVIKFTPDGFQGTVQDNPFTFPNRLEEDKYTLLRVDGGARVRSIEIK
ncbi:beta-galactoside-binding lectin-like [Parambassis ranga]|uniref:Galectin n=1 Tax=Parambassis ranga TaxID=210632 RepID=A0A6P7IUR0_9TELE|nr:beta-galactoside-binding lectin-like [Parambassis ranga]